MSEIFAVERAADGTTPVRYSCQQLMANNQASTLKVEYYYDILHDSGVDTATAVATGEAALLNSVAAEFGLIDGARCSIPPVTSLWLTDVTSNQPDESVDAFGECLELKPGDGQSCSVYKGYMEAQYLGEGDPESFQSFIQQNLNSIGGDQGLQIAYLGAQLDTTFAATDSGRDSLNPSASKAESPATEDPGKKTFTFVGGLMVAGFLAAFLGLFLVLYRRRQRFLAAQEMEIALSKSDMDDMSPGAGDPDSSSRDVRPDQLDPEIGEEDEEFPTNYRFDLGTSMKNELFNIHGRAADGPRSYGIGIEETSDSDADSWAQTDGTIGSLELQLEPITAEV